LGFANTTPKTLGRASYNPLTLAKLYVYCYEEGIRSSRKIEKACRINVEVMWLTGGLAPDFKTIADFRRDNTKALINLFYEFGSFLDSAGLFGKKIVSTDGTKIRASNSKKRNISRKSLERRIEHHKTKIEQFLREIDSEDDADAIEELAEKAAVALSRLDEAEALLDEMDASGASEISLTDPDARCMGKGRQGMHVSYNVQLAVDEKYHLVTALDITNRPDDHGQLSNMASLTQQTLRKRDIEFITDKGYYGSDDLKVCKDAGIMCIVSPQGKPGSKSGNAYTVDNFTYDRQSDSYLCPEGAILSCKSKDCASNKLYSNKQACLACSAAPECKSSGYSYRRIRRRPENDILEWADEHYRENIELYKLRQQMVEHPFGTVKRTMDGDHFLLRGLEKVKGEAALFFLGYNLKRSKNVLGFDEMMARMDEYAALVRASGSFLSLRMSLFSLIWVAMRAILKGFPATIPAVPSRHHALVA